MSWPDNCKRLRNGFKETGNGGLPTEKFLGVASKRGFFLVFGVLLLPKGAAAGFFPDPGLALGGWSLRRSQHRGSGLRNNAASEL